MERRAFLRLVLGAAVGVPLSACGRGSPSEGGGRILLAYFSRPGENYWYGGRRNLRVGNTEVLARMISERLDCDVHRIEAVDRYPFDYEETVERNVREQDADARPDIADPPASIDRYDTILLASPIWNVRAPMIMSTFAEAYDFSGKTVLPVTTHAMSGLGTTPEDYAQSCRGARIGTGLAVRGEQVRSAGAAVDAWLRRTNLRVEPPRVFPRREGHRLLATLCASGIEACQEENMAFGGIRRRGSAAVVVMASAVLWTGTATASSSLTVSGLKTNGLSEPLGIGDATPDFSWRLAGAGRAAKQTAYETRVAASGSQLATGPYLWQSGKVSSSHQSDVVWGGQPLPSRQPAAWQVRVWDAAGEVSAWSAPATFETGLLQQSDWGSAKWIELAGRNNTQPLPIFARGFSVDSGKTVENARLYMSGLGLFEAQLNGSKLTDEVLAPGYTNYQLSAEYRTYDVTDELRGGANTLGVELGNGTANNIKMANPAVGRVNSFAWWNSTAVGSGTLTAPAAAGATNVGVSSVANYYLGGTINIDTGDGGDRLESRTITAIGTAPASTTLATPAAAGDTNVKLNSVTGMAVGGKLNIGSETKTITEVGHGRGQHDAGGRHDRRRAAAPAAVAGGRELALERRGPFDHHACRHDLRAQDVHRGRPGDHRARAAAHQRRRLARHVRQR